MDADDPRPRWRRRVPDEEVPPQRPAHFTPHELRFEPQPAVRWFSPGVLTASGLRVGVTSGFGSYLAKREPRVRVVDQPLPRGRILVLGGAEVYPVASPEGYDHRLEGPWRAALPWTGPPSATLYAIPGNHDWFDGLTGFMRLFGQGRWIGGWRTHQTRSYFAAQLPHRWWLWGVDIQSDALIDEPQLDFFPRAAERAPPGGE